MAQPDSAVPENVRAARQAQGLSLDQLSARSGVSKSMLRQIEIGRSSPTVSILWKIANGLKLPFSSLLSRRQGEMEVHDFISGESIRSGKKGYRLHPMIGFQPDRPLEVYYVEIDPGVSFDGEPHQGKAREVVFVISGVVEVSLGDRTSGARESQYIQFQAGEAHRYHNPGRKVARVVMSIDYAV